MAVGVKHQWFFHLQIGRLFVIIGTVVVVILMCQSIGIFNKNDKLVLTSPSKSSIVPTIESSILLKNSKPTKVEGNLRVTNNIMASNPEDLDETVDDGVIDEDGLMPNNTPIQSISDKDESSRKENFIQKKSGEDRKQISIESSSPALPVMPSRERVTLNPNSRIPLSTIAGKQSRSTDKPLMMENSIVKRRGGKTVSISQMNLLLLQSFESDRSKKPKSSSPRDRELQSARFKIEHAPIVKETQEVDVSLFRNFSMFKRSYELMENTLKVYIYKEGDKPIFHQPYLKGIYASEGWFLKLMEGNKKFVTKDPRKAHLFYIPVSILNLRGALHEEGFRIMKDMTNHLKKYTDMIAKKYRFWNRVKAADHFVVGCHDWGPRLMRNSTGNSIRVLCNSNIGRGFTIGKDVSLPVTYIRSGQNPQKDLGGNSSSDRPILAFFAGSMHGYLRPILLQYWENKKPDMKILGPMPRGVESKARYRDYMKSSKYCICARGFEVHTPRVVESIYYECVPVIISDNYVPPLFEVLDWEAFSVFVLEKDIPNLRNILLSIPEEKYVAMQQRVKMVQRHFLWNKKPVKYDLFHMILHSVWYNRIFQIEKDRENSNLSG